jgi:RNA polymerase sigma-70 factor (ECF subfamily)
VREHERRLGRFLVQVVGNRQLAEDLLQETFLTAFREDLQSVENVGAWLFAVARNRALQALRSGRRAQSAFQRLTGSVDAGGADPAEVIAVRDLLARSLEPDDRMLLILRHLHGLESAELAEIFDLSPEAVRQRLSRARRRLLEATREPVAPPTTGWAGRQAAAGPAPVEFHEDESARMLTEGHRVQGLLAPLDEVEPVSLPRSVLTHARWRQRTLRRLLARIRH